MKKIVKLFAVLALLLLLVGCSSDNNKNTAKNTDTSNKNAQSNVTNETNTNKEEDELDIDFEASAQKQMSMPEKGEEIAIFHIKDYGEVKVKFFEEVAPKAVENFLTHAKNGYYDNVTFHRVINEFMIQGGDPLGTGTGGESIWGSGFAEELAQELVPYRGSLCMASKGTGTSSLGSQFFITQANYSSTLESRLKQGGYPEELIEQYKANGGYLSLYLQYTVFGQVFEGMDVVDQIAATPTNGSDKPLTDVVIETIEVITY